MEAAEDAKDDDLAEYHKKRAKMAYDRAVFYGLELLKHTDEGFEAARKNHDIMGKWLSDHFTDKENDVPNIFWTGYAWMARVALMKGDPDVGAQYVADLDVGVSMVERAVQLDSTYNNHSGLVALAAYHSRMRSVTENAQAKELFEKALQLTERKTLMVQLNYATRFACVTGDRALYDKLLNEVLAADDPDPKQRFTNTLAKRRAKRWLLPRRMKEECGFSGPSTTPAPTPVPSPPPPPG
jgi:hypothetical protein